MSKPWLDEPDHEAFESSGLPCIIHRSPATGAWCGYVAVPHGHPLHGADYDSADVSVHGGLTHAAPCEGDICHAAKPGESDNAWWFGFDCAHSGDYMPKMGRFGDVSEYRDRVYAVGETCRLAAQLRLIALQALVDSTNQIVAEHGPDVKYTLKTTVSR
jgi:hypothetical protein